MRLACPVRPLAEQVSSETPEIARRDARSPQPEPMNHLIHRVRVELRANSHAAAIAAQEATSRALQHDLDAVEAAFDARFPEKMMHRLDWLDVDLGALPLRGFRKAFISALVKSLAGLGAKVPPASAVRISASVQPAQRKSLAAAGSKDAVEVFLYYVVHGSLPWFFSLERWRDEIPRALISGDAFSTLRSRLPSLISEEPTRLTRLLPFPGLVSVLFASEFRLAEESVARGIAAASLAGSFATRIRLALWYLRLNPEPDAKVQTTLLRLFAIDRGGVPSMEPSDVQSLLSALAAVGEIAKSGEIARLSQLIVGAHVPGSQLRPRERTEFAVSESPALAEDLAENGIPTASAGIVLLHPFLIRFFQLFGWLDDRLRILNERSWHAVHALRWIAHKQPARDDADLVLEKALCGIPLGEVACWPELEYRVTEEADSLLRAVIGHWQALKDTSPDSLREAFLARPGLFYPVEPPRLHVETRAYDMLLSRLPWSFDRVALPWLSSPIQVRWPKPA
jgi:Contractile injection system tape measure protein